jgi:hypothetical protein
VSAIDFNPNIGVNEYQLHAAVVDTDENYLWITRCELVAMELF